MAKKSRAKGKLYESKIDLPEERRAALVELCNQLLADTFDLYSMAKQAHWNVKGMEFRQLHELFDGVAEALFPFVDELAERATTLGGVALGTVRLAAAASRLEEYPSGLAQGREHLEAVRVKAPVYVAKHVLEQSALRDEFGGGAEA